MSLTLRVSQQGGADSQQTLAEIGRKLGGIFRTTRSPSRSPSRSRLTWRCVVVEGRADTLTESYLAEVRRIVAPLAAQRPCSGEVILLRREALDSHQTQTDVWLEKLAREPGEADMVFLVVPTRHAELDLALELRAQLMKSVGIFPCDDLAQLERYVERVTSRQRRNSPSPLGAPLLACDIASALRPTYEHLLTPLLGHLHAGTAPARSPQDFDALLATNTSAPVMTASHGDVWTSERHGAAFWNTGQTMLSGPLAQGLLRGRVLTSYGCHTAGTTVSGGAMGVLRGAAYGPPEDRISSDAAQLLHDPHGPLAIVGHVDEVCQAEIRSSDGRWTPIHEPWLELFNHLGAGRSVGEALLDAFWIHQVVLNAQWTFLLGRNGNQRSEREWERLALAWMAAMDTRGWVVLGDPALVF